MAGEDPGVFHVTGSTGEEYILRLDEPSCTCVDWSVYHWPCKYMLAVITSGSAAWTSIPVDYRGNVFLTLDVPPDEEDNSTLDCQEEVIEPVSIPVAEEAVLDLADEDPLDQEVSTNSSHQTEIPASLTRNISETLERIKGLLYQQVDAKLLRGVKAGLANIEEQLKEGRLQNEEGLLC